MFVVYTIIAVVYMIYNMMLKYDSVQMLLVYSYKYNKGTYIHTEREYSVGYFC